MHELIGTVVETLLEFLLDKAFEPRARKSRAVSTLRDLPGAFPQKVKK